MISPLKVIGAMGTSHPADPATRSKLELAGKSGDQVGEGGAAGGSVNSALQDVNSGMHVVVEAGMLPQLSELELIESKKRAGTFKRRPREEGASPKATVWVEALGKRSAEEAMELDPEVQESRKKGKVGEKKLGVLEFDFLDAGLSEQLRETQ